MDRYEPAAIEAKWQKVWDEEQTFHTPDPAPGDEPPNHWYQLEMLPYPSGTLHMGHVLNYTMGDVLTHFHRRHGLSVLRPIQFFWIVIVRSGQLMSSKFSSSSA